MIFLHQICNTHRLNEIHHSMRAATRWFDALVNTTSEIVVDEVDEKAGISYSCPAQHRHSHHNTTVGWPISIFRDHTTVPRTGMRYSPHLLPPSGVKKRRQGPVDSRSQWRRWGRWRQLELNPRSPPSLEREENVLYHTPNFKWMIFFHKTLPALILISIHHLFIYGTFQLTFWNFLKKGSMCSGDEKVDLMFTIDSHEN
jgi:hypothetical protein